jgi:hypothetical protein
MSITPRHFGGPIPPTEPPRNGTQPLLIAGFSAVVLVALSGAFLIGLAVVGLLAAAISGFDLVRRRIWRPGRPSLGALDHQVLG